MYAPMDRWQSGIRWPLNNYGGIKGDESNYWPGSFGGPVGIRGPFDNYTILGAGPTAPAGEPMPREFYYYGVGGRYLTRTMSFAGRQAR